MIEVALNPPRNRKTKSRTRRKKRKSSRRRKAARVCIPKRELRKVKRLSLLKRRAKPRRKDLICIPKSTLAKSKSLKKLKTKHLGVKYGFAKRAGQRKLGFLERLLGPSKPAPKPKKRKKAKARPKAKPKSRRYSYHEVLSLTPYERRAAGITTSKVKQAGRKGSVSASPKAPKAKRSWWPKGNIAANPARRHRFNYVVPTYAFNDGNEAAALDGIRSGLTAGYRPGLLMQAAPVAGGLIANSLISGMATKAISERFNLTPKWKGPVGIAIGLASAGLLGVGTSMVQPKYAKHVLLGGMAQVMMDAYQTYIRPTVEGALNIPGMLGSPDLTFGLYCPECNVLGDFLTPTQVEMSKPVISDTVGMVMPQSAIVGQVPPNPSAPVTAKVNGQEVNVERIPVGSEGVGDFGDFLTPNQVAEASPLGDLSALLS
jgi:hypothetical protein